MASRIAASKGVRLLAAMVVGLVGLGFGGCWTTLGLSSPGAYGVGVRAGIPLVDAERGREIPVTVWYPAPGEPGVSAPDIAPSPDGPFPLIVFAHGLGDSPATLGPLAVHLASHGFVIAAPKFPGSILADPVLDLVNDIVHHPGDVTLVIDAALGIGEPFPVDVSAVIDPHRIGMLGLSNGGLATYLTTFDRELREPRIRIAVTLAGGGGDQFQPLFYDFAWPKPLLIIHGTADALIPYEAVSGAVFERSNWPVRRLTLVGGSHIGYSEGIPVFPGTHPDFLACLFFPPIDPNDPEAGIAFEYLAGRTPDTGVEIDLTTPLPCTFGAQNLPAMTPQRQSKLARAGILAYLLAHFGDTLGEKGRALGFLEHDFNAENEDAFFEKQPPPWSAFFQ
jgi:predicted dienelactone hydrolase